MSQPVGGRRAWQLEPRDRRAALLYCTCREERREQVLRPEDFYLGRRVLLLPGEELLQDLPGLPDGPRVTGLEEDPRPGDQEGVLRYTVG